MRYLSTKVFAQLCAVIILFIASLNGCSRENTNKASAPSSAKNEAAGTVLAIIPEQEKLRESGPANHTMSPAVQNLFQIVFNDQGRGVAYISEAAGKVRVVLNGRAGKPYQGIGTMALSPDGQRIAYSALDNDKWRMVVDGREGKIVDEIGNPVFSPDSRHIAYEASVGKQWRLILDEKRSRSCPPRYVYRDKFFSSDSAKIITIENTVKSGGPLQVVVSNLELKQLSVKEIQGTNIVYNKDRTRMALVGEKNGKKLQIQYDLSRPGILEEGPLYDAIIRHTFGIDGVSVPYVAERGGERYLVLQGKEVQIPKSDEIESLAVRPDKGGACLILGSHDGYYLYQVLSDRETTEKQYDGAGGLIYNSDGSRHAYIAKKGKNIFIVVNGKEGPAFDMVVSPMFSPDDRLLIYRARKDGRRFVVVADATGKKIRQHPAYEQVFQPVFTADGQSIAYGVKDGQRLIWKVEKL